MKQLGNCGMALFSCGRGCAGSITHKRRRINLSFHLISFVGAACCPGHKRIKEKEELRRKRREVNWWRKLTPFISSTINRHWMVDCWNEMMGLPRPAAALGLRSINQTQSIHNSISFVSFHSNKFHFIVHSRWVCWFHSLCLALLVWCWVCFHCCGALALLAPITHNNSINPNQPTSAALLLN